MRVKGNRAGAMTPSRWDAPALILLLLVTLFLEKSVAPYERPASLTDPSLQHPHLPDLVPVHILLMLSATLPFATFLLLEYRSLRFKRTLFLTFAVCLFEAVVPTVLLTNVLKLIIGRPRPYFATACIAYTAESVCTGNIHEVEEARKSFPSGHTSLSFSVAIYLALYLHLRLQASESPSAPRTWRLLVVLLYPIAAALVGASRVIDYHHHYADIVAGGCLGSAVAVTAFSLRQSAFAKLTEADADRVLLENTFSYEGIPTQDAV